jgi:hypothetical protein
MAPYRRAVVGAGDPVTVPFRVSEDGRTLGSFVVRVSTGEMTALLDPGVTGVIARRAVDEYWVGARRFVPDRVTVAPAAPPNQVRLGLDQFWALHLEVDERAGTLSLGEAPALGVSSRVTRIPFVLKFPGMDLVPRPGTPPVDIAGRDGRALLRGARWQVNASEATVDVRR